VKCRKAPPFKNPANRERARMMSGMVICHGDSWADSRRRQILLVVMIVVVVIGVLLLGEERRAPDRPPGTPPRT